ncbi:hypothetical protein [Turneriella parva]|uniref:Uncharacterized protein n=1 Tax=Turneriella parva (strain ATCC BAA-1111 / DSM 21527 / NCTC 11395 / H) TaxID=869212 RepID=I4B2H9_TURPD|nr:hypothetical protein [Turneriella parva]AFM11486.1 hypothetical protein Turpa_0835 [Turneriella parva DSM 21527]
MRKFIMLCLALALAGTVSAKKYPHPDSGVVVDIPGSWDVSGDANSLHAQTKDGHAHMFFQVMDADNMEAALSALDGELNKVVQNLSHDEAKQTKINGMKALSIDGKGTVEGHNVELGILVIQTPKNKELLVFGMVSEEGLKKYQKGLTRILRGIKPLK